MAKKSVPPSISKAAFDCPHCGAYTTQYWFHISAREFNKEKPLPYIPKEEDRLAALEERSANTEAQKVIAKIFDKYHSGLVFFSDDEESSYSYTAYNLHISKCYHCEKITVWVHGNIVFPNEKEGPLPNQDLPEDIIQDFEEARTIVGLSPRGAAALLRLCLQKLCAFLGEKGKDLDKDIASLVKKGLNPLVQKSLDIVRVIGNEAVHPGVIDLNDNRDTANKLFDLINSIADQMISHPNNVQKLYEQLPEGKRKAIEERNGEAKK